MKVLMGNSFLMGLLLGVAVVTWVGCGGGQLEESAENQTPAAESSDPHAGLNMGGGALGSSGPTDEHALPLKLTGLNSAAELKAGMEATQNEEARTFYEAGFRKTFTADAAKRDYAGAVRDLEHAISLDGHYAEAYRALGYAKFNQGFNVDGAMGDYLKAVELKPSYGEAHYALAFMYAMGDREKGAVHFNKAMELGIPDERDLKTKFYSN